MPDAVGSFPEVPSLRPVPGLAIRSDVPTALVDPVEAVRAAAASAGYSLLARNRRDVERLAGAALAAGYGASKGECEVEYRHPIHHKGDVITEDWNRGWTVFVTKTLMGGLGFVTPPQTSVWEHPQTSKRYLRFVARALPLRPIDPPAVADLRRASGE